MAHRGFTHLSSLFPSGAQPPVLADAEFVVSAFRQAGFMVLPLGEYLSIRPAPKEAIVVAANPESFAATNDLNERFSQSAVLDIPLLSFSADSHAVEYLLRRLQEIDFASACERSLRTVDCIERATKPIVVSTGSHELVVNLGDDIHIALPKLEPKIAAGEWISIAQFLEVGLVPNEQYNCFRVSGSLLCDGAAVAHHHGNYSVSRPLATRAWSELLNLRQNGDFPLVVNLEESHVTSIMTTGGRDVLPLFLPLIDKTFHGKLIEFSFASLPSDSTVDWSVNSQVNEASGGVHVALGTGVDAAHIDFIASGARWE